MGITLVLDQDDPGAALWDEHRDAWQAWCAVSGQWRVIGGFGGVAWLGLDTAAARAALELAGIAVTPATWAEVRAIEAGAVERLNRER